MKDFVAENDCILEEWRNAYVNNNQSEYPDCKNLHEYFTPDEDSEGGDGYHSVTRSSGYTTPIKVKVK